MKLLHFVALLAFSCAALAAPSQAAKENEVKRTQLNADAYEWIFLNEDDQLYVNLSIGVPSQNVRVVLNDIHTNNFLKVSNKDYGGDYDSSASRSYRWYGSHMDVDGAVDGDVGVEQYQLGDFVVPNGYFIDLYRSHPKGSFGLGLNTERSDDFLRRLLKSLGDQTITIAFDNYPKSGALTLGGIDTKRCYKNWRLMPLGTYKSTDGTGTWGLNVTNISVGKFAQAQPGHILFSLSTEETRWPKEMYGKILKQLGSIDGQTVSCDVTTTIDFQVEDVTISLTPDIYLDRDMQQDMGVCMLAGETVDKSNEFLLPREIFQDFCLSLNHKRNEVGLAAKRKSNTKN